MIISSFHFQFFRKEFFSAVPMSTNSFLKVINMNNSIEISQLLTGRFCSSDIFKIFQVLLGSVGKKRNQNGSRKISGKTTQN